MLLKEAIRRSQPMVFGDNCFVIREGEPIDTPKVIISHAKFQLNYFLSKKKLFHY